MTEDITQESKFSFMDQAKEVFAIERTINNKINVRLNTDINYTDAAKTFFKILNSFAKDFNITKRPTVNGIEEEIQVEHKCLDSGFIRLIDYMGDDSAIVQAARVSYGTGTKTVNEDKGLINYLMKHHHGTPFEMCEIKFHMKLPIFVARQLIRHRTANVNEYSARYSILDKEFYIPHIDDLAPQSKVNHQGRDEKNPLSHDEARRVLEILREDAHKCYEGYEEMMNNCNLARELARMNLNLNYYTQWYWKIDLRNLFSFLKLRQDSHAQKEIRVYADVIAKIVEKWVPLAFSAYEEYMKNAVTLSKSQKDVIKSILNNSFDANNNNQDIKDIITHIDSNLSKREREELIKIFTDDNN